MSQVYSSSGNPQNTKEIITCMVDTKTTMKSFAVFFLVALIPLAVMAEESLGCNICGCDNCTFGFPQGVVWFVYNNKQEKRPCLLLQQQVENPNIYNRTYCHNVIWKQAFDVCQCYDKNYPEVLLSDLPGK